MKRIYASNIISPYHVAGLKSFISNFLDDEEFSGHIMLSSAHWEKPLLCIEDLDLLDSKVLVSFSEPEFSVRSLCIAWVLLLFRNSPNADSYIIGHSRVNLKLIAHLYQQGIVGWNTAFSIVVFDEGIGSYGNFSYLFKAYLRQSKAVWWHRLLYLFVYPVNQIVLRLRSFIDINWRLIKITRNGLEENSVAICKYREYFCSTVGSYRRQDGEMVLLITQPLVELGLIEAEEYFNVLSKLVLETKQLGYSLYIKIHPSENAMKYRALGIDLIGCNSPVEILIAELKPLFVFGLTSTALINCKLIMGRDSYSILSLFKKNKSMLQLINDDYRIKKIFKHYVKRISDWNQLRDLLGKNSKEVQERRVSK